MPNVPSARDHSGNEGRYSAETRNACVAKFHQFASSEFSPQEMIEKHTALHHRSRVGSSGKRASKRKHSHRFSWHVIAFAALGCATPRATTAEPQSAAKFTSSSRSLVEVPRTVITPDLTTDITELSKQAFELGEARHFEAAGRAYDRIFELEPDGSTGLGALFKAAEMYDYAGLQEQALARYEQVARRFPTSDVDSVARIRALRLLTYLEHYERAGELAELTSAKYPDLQRSEEH